MKLFQSLVTYLRSSKSELEKVSWPSRQQTIRYSTLVIAATVILAAFFATLDLGLGKLVDAALAARTKSISQPQEQKPDIQVAPTTSTETPVLDFNAEPQTVTPTDTDTKTQP
jgi:preprotein translocase subunit SecE